VFSAANESVSVLIRALKAQRRIDVLSRPTVMTLDKQAAVITVGQEIPIQEGSNVTATGVISNVVNRRSLGVILQVTPQITPDGRILMRIIPEVSSIADRAYPLGNGQFSTSLNIQHLETTVSAYDGDTIMLGGMITKSDERAENKIPWLGDLPGIGAAFRFRLEERKKTELIIIMTPHIVRNREEAQAILADESRRIDWNLPDIERVHGKGNCTVFQPYFEGGHTATKPVRIPNALQMPPMPKTLPASNVTPPSGPQVIPAIPPQTSNVPQPAPPVNPVAPLSHNAPAPANNMTSVPAAMPIQPAPQKDEPAIRPSGRGGLLKNLFVPLTPRQSANEPSSADKSQVIPAPVPMRDPSPALQMPSAADRIPVIVPTEPGAVPPPASPLRIER
jgi:general secretion pathway protein D